MSQDMLSIAAMLQRGNRQPHEVFPFYRPDPDNVDQALVVEFSPRDEFGGGDPKDWAIARTTRVCSCSSRTIERWNQVSTALATFQHLQAVEIKKQADAQAKGETYKPQPVHKPAEADMLALEIAAARILGEGVLSWDPAPPAVVGIPDLNVKRGDPLPLPEQYLPDDVTSYEMRPNAKVVAIVRAMPNRFFHRVIMGVTWTSNLEVTRFFPTDEEVEEDKARPQDEQLGLQDAPKDQEDAGKHSGSPSAGPSSEPETASESETDG